jgi:hypothetical protein
VMRSSSRRQRIRSSGSPTCSAGSIISCCPQTARQSKRQSRRLAGSRISRHSSMICGPRSRSPYACLSRPRCE